MSSDDQQPNQSARFRLAQAIRIFDGNPFWWRDICDEIECGLGAGNTNQQSATQQLKKIVELIQLAQERALTFPDPAIREGLRRHYDLASKEAYEFAEEHGLALARAVQPSERPEPPGRGR